MKASRPGRAPPRQQAGSQPKAGARPAATHETFSSFVRNLAKLESGRGQAAKGEANRG